MGILKIILEIDHLKKDPPVEIQIKEKSWVDLPPTYPYRGHPSGHTLVAPLIQGWNIVAEIECAGPLPLQEQPYFGLDGIMSYPNSDVLFCRRNLRQHRQGVYTFRTEYGSRTASEHIALPSLDFLRANLPDHIKRDYVHPVEEAREMVEVMTSLARTLDDVLDEIYQFVTETANQQPHQEPINAWNVKYIIDEYYGTGRFSGDCKSLSTFFAGLAQTLGIPARIVGGLLTKKHLDTETDLGGHFWPEVYIPQDARRGCWMPFDPANHKLDTVKAFTSTTVTYHIETKIPPFGNQPARLRVSYE